MNNTITPPKPDKEKPKVNEAGQKLNEFTGQESFRDTIGTLKEDGSRNWIMPKKTSGKFTTARNIVATILMVILLAGPFLSINGHPLLLLNILDRKFVIFGQPFWPQDFHLFVFAVLATVVFIVLFTVIFGRIFCGWVCPQTIFMEFVFRRIEQWIEGDGFKQQAFNKKPYDTDKIIRKTVKHILFFSFSFMIANVFLAYLVGKEQLYHLIEDTPANHMASFIALVAFSGAFYFVFSKFREQACIIACPYGRLQGVLLDNNSVVVAYDYVRGEPRGKIRKAESVEEGKKGDCVDCGLCVQVCPTGIDIRNGTQLECINCTACIDACNEVMVKTERPKGLIRYATQNEIANGEKFKFTTRMKAYSVILALLIGVFTTTLFLRSDVETTVLRVPGALYSMEGENFVTNVYQYQLVNKTTHAQALTFQIPIAGASVTHLGKDHHIIRLKEEEIGKGLLLIRIPRKSLTGVKTKLRLEVYNAQNQQVDVAKTTFMGPSR